jgi:hypothetical protein
MKHDYKVYKYNHPDIPKDIERMFDLGTCHLQGKKVQDNE